MSQRNGQVTSLTMRESLLVLVLVLVLLPALNRPAEASWQCPQPPDNLSEARWEFALESAQNLLGNGPKYDEDFEYIVRHEELLPYFKRYYPGVNIDDASKNFEERNAAYHVFRAAYCVALPPLTDFDLQLRSRSHARVLSNLLNVSEDEEP